MEKLELILITDSVSNGNWDVFTQWWIMTVAISFGIPPRYFSKIVPKNENINLLVGIMFWYRPAIVLILVILLLVVIQGMV
jgi:hypothetical protein